VAFIGDGYNMCNSYVNASRQWGFKLRIACPPGYEPDRAHVATAPRRGAGGIAARGRGRRRPGGDRRVVVDGARRGSRATARCLHAPYQVNEALLDRARPDVLFMHCLPAHRGEEISTTLLDDPRCVAWQEAGNRLHTQKALLEFLLT
jgi:ornithine carbamoyltransferase